MTILSTAVRCLCKGLFRSVMLMLATTTFKTKKTSAVFNADQKEQKQTKQLEMRLAIGVGMGVEMGVEMGVDGDRG